MVEKIAETDVGVSSDEAQTKIKSICEEIVRSGALITEKVKEVKQGGWFRRGYLVFTIKVRYDSSNAEKVEKLINKLGGYA